MRTSHKIVAAVIALGSVAILGACSDTGKFAQNLTDAPVNKTVDYSEAKIIAMPDGFSNVATKCDENGNRIYVIFKSNGSYGALQVVPADPSCDK